MVPRASHCRSSQPPCQLFSASPGPLPDPADVLARFEQDMAYLAATELHPSLRGEGSTHLVHLVPAGALREAAAACMRGHQHFAGKVAELEGLFGGLRADVEALFMQVHVWVH